MLRLSRALILAFALLGCQSSSEDGEHASFAGPGGAADAYGVDEGSYLALAVLQVANSAGEATLTSQVGLSSRTAGNVVQVRSRGAFASLVALDAVPWFGPVSFDRMVAYVESQGLVGSCGDGLVQDNELCDGSEGCSSTCSVGAADGATEMIVEIRLLDRADGFGDEEGWTYDEEEYEWIYEESVRADQLPFRHSTGDFWIGVEADGRSSLSYSGGDADVTAEATATFPTTGALLSGAPGTQYELALSGGDHAGGSWGCDGVVRITLN